MTLFASPEATAVLGTQTWLMSRIFQPSQVRMVATCILIGHLMTLAPSYWLMKNGFSMEGKQ